MATSVENYKFLPPRVFNIAAEEFPLEFCNGISAPIGQQKEF